MNQVVEILLKFLESGDWKHSFFEVIPLRKRGEAGTEGNAEEGEGKDEDETEAGADDEDSIGMDDQKAKRPCISAEIKA